MNGWPIQTTRKSRELASPSFQRGRGIGILLQQLEQAAVDPAGDGTAMQLLISLHTAHRPRPDDPVQRSGIDADRYQAFLDLEDLGPSESDLGRRISRRSARRSLDGRRRRRRGGGLFDRRRRLLAGGWRFGGRWSDGLRRDGDRCEHGTPRGRRDRGLGNRRLDDTAQIAIDEGGGVISSSGRSGHGD